MALNDDEKGLSIELFGLIFSTTCLESGNAEFVFPKKFIRRFRKLFSTTLYLFLGGWWQIFVLLDARSQLLEVIFLLVQTEAQYNSDTINNISTVGVVKWGSSIFILWCRKILKSECYIGVSDVVAMNLRRLVYQAISRMFFRALISLTNPVSFLEAEDADDWGKERYGTISSYLVLQVQFWRRQKMLKECWMLLESQEQEGRSWQRRLVRKVLYCSSRCFRSQRRRRADERTFDASHDVFKTGCSKLWSCLHEKKKSSTLRQDDTEDIFLSLFTLWNRSVAVLFFFLFLFLASPAWVNV